MGCLFSQQAANNDTDANSFLVGSHKGKSKPSTKYHKAKGGLNVDFFESIGKDDIKHIDIQNEGNEEESRKLNPKDFKLIKLLGRGGFASVYLVEKKATKELYAMKVMYKDVLKKNSQKIRVQKERSILQNVNCPFIVQMHYAFQTGNKLFIILEFIQGGELFFHLRKNFNFQDKRAQFYAAELLLTIEYLHKHGIIYRDLKPENIMLDTKGHIKMTDFGLSKEGMTETSTTKSFCGTLEYIAPEIIKGPSHDMSADYYSMGAFLYEMLAGIPPFYSQDKTKMIRDRFEKPLEKRSTINYTAMDLIEKLMKTDPKERLCDPEEIKKHDFFRGIKWDQLKKKAVKPPFVPKLKGPRDLRYFDQRFLDEKVDNLTIHSDVKTKYSIYPGFSYGPNDKMPGLIGSNFSNSSDQ